MIKHTNLVVPVKCKEGDSVKELSLKMKETKSRFVFIVNDQRAPVGIIAGTDIIYRVVAEGKNPEQVFCKDIMTSPIKVLTEDDPIEEAYKFMCTEDFYSVPIVTKDGQLLGVLNFDEAMRVMSQEDKKK